jgi:hypothetical protein
MKTVIRIVNSNNISEHMISDLFLHGENIPRQTGKLRNGLIYTNGSDVNLFLSMNSFSGTITTLTEVLISIILNLRTLHSGKDYPLIGYPWYLQQSFWVCDLMKSSSYLKQKSITNRIRTRQRVIISKTGFTYTLKLEYETEMYRIATSHQRDTC